MSLEDDLRAKANDKQEALRLKAERRKKLADAWEKAKEGVIRPQCGILVKVSQDYDFFTATCDCDGDACILTLDSPKSERGTPATLRFSLDLERGKIASRSDFNGEHIFTLEPPDAAGVEQRISHFYDAFLATVTKG